MDILRNVWYFVDGGGIMRLIKKLVFSVLTWLVLTGILVAIDNTFSISEKTDWFAFIGILLPISCAILLLFKKNSKNTSEKTRSSVVIPLDDVPTQAELKKVYSKAPGKPKCPKCGSENIDSDFNLNENIGKQSKIGTPMRCKDCSERWILVSIRNSVEIPAEQSERNVMAYTFLTECKKYAELATKSEDISVFLDYWEKIMFKLEQLSAFEGIVDFKGTSPSQEQKRLCSEFQEKLQAAIHRHKEKVISVIKENPEHMTEEVDSFCQSIKNSMYRFSQETVSVAEESSDQIQKEIKKQKDRAISLAKGDLDCSIKDIDYDQIMKDEAEWRREQMGKSVVEQELDRVDKMDGHTFERWCASLLEASGFKDVEVTRGSGDQGVDVLATLDGVRYAVQCKCYASDLGNKPVQEVYAGIAIYKCQLGSVMTNRRFTSGAKELAAATGISLWDRDWIISLLEELDDDAFPL